MWIIAKSATASGSLLFTGRSLKLYRTSRHGSCWAFSAATFSHALFGLKSDCRRSKWVTDFRRTYAVRQSELYDALGLSPNADPDQIKAAYFRLSKIYHPDVCKDPVGVEKFVDISKAYQILGNEDKRREYDRGISSFRDYKPKTKKSHPHEDLTFEDLRTFQEAAHDRKRVKANRTVFVKRENQRGLEDFHNYYNEHVVQEMKSSGDHEKIQEYLKNIRQKKYRKNNPPSLLSRILEVLSTLMVVVICYWYYRY